MRFEFSRLSYLRSHAGAGRDELAAFGAGEAEPAARCGVAELARGLLLARRRLRRLRSLQHAGQGRGAAAAGLGQTRRLVALGKIVALVGVRRAFPQRREGRAGAEKHRAEKHRDPTRPLSRVRCFGSGSPPARRGVLARVESAFEESARRFGRESVAREMRRVNLGSPASSRGLSRDAGGIREGQKATRRASVESACLAGVRCARGVVCAAARLAAARHVQHLSREETLAWIFFGAERDERRSFSAIDRKSRLKGHRDFQIRTPWTSRERFPNFRTFGARSSGKREKEERVFFFFLIARLEDARNKRATKVVYRTKYRLTPFTTAPLS